jgi:transcriptional regulator with XRE-family HTH domain
MSFSQKVRKLLQENKMTKAELAKDAGIAYTTLDSMLKRETDTERFATIFRIAKALGTSVEALIFDEEGKKTTPEEERLRRRIRRDVNKRGRTEESVREQFEKTVRPMHELFVEPSRSYADVVIIGGGKDPDAVASLVERIKELNQEAKTF